MGFSDENRSSSFDVRISKTLNLLLQIKQKDVSFCDTKASSSFDVNILNTPDLEKEKLYLTGKINSPHTDADSQLISLIQKQKEDDINVSEKSSSPNTESPRGSLVQKPSEEKPSFGDKSSSYGAEVSNQNISDSQLQVEN